MFGKIGCADCTVSGGANFASQWDFDRYREHDDPVCWGWSDLSRQPVRNKTHWGIEVTLVPKCSSELDDINILNLWRKRLLQRYANLFQSKVVLAKRLRVRAFSH